MFLLIDSEIVVWKATISAKRELEKGERRSREAGKVPQEHLQRPCHLVSCPHWVCVDRPPWEISLRGRGLSSARGQACFSALSSAFHSQIQS